MNLGQRIYSMWLILSLWFLIIIGYCQYKSGTPDGAILFVMGIGWCITSIAGILSHKTK